MYQPWKHWLVERSNRFGGDSMLFYELDCEFVHETPGAVLLCFGGEGGEEVWVPRSIITDHDAEYSFVVLPEWFVEKEGLDSYVDSVATKVW